MNRAFNPRIALRTVAAGVGPVACVGTFIATRPVIRCDAPTLATGPPRRRQSSFDVSPETVKQVSSGSIAGLSPLAMYSTVPLHDTDSRFTPGFGVGVIVALFSKALAFFGGLFALSVHVSPNSRIS